MSVLYCMYKKGTDKGYIGLDNPGGNNFFPRVTDHIKVGYFAMPRDSQEDPDKLKDGTKFETILARDGAFNYTCVASIGSLGDIPSENYKAFREIWKQECANPKLSFAEMCYIYKFRNTYASYNTNWGGYKNNFVLDVQSFLTKKGLSADTIEKLGIKTKLITWSPASTSTNNLESISLLFYPEIHIFKQQTELLLKDIWKEPAKTIAEILVKKASASVGGKGKSQKLIITLDISSLEKTLTKEVTKQWTQIKNSLSKIAERLFIKPVYNDNWITTWSKTAAQKLSELGETTSAKVKSATEKVSNEISLDVDKVVARIDLENKTEYPKWFPQNLAAPTSFTNIDWYVQDYSALVLFPTIYHGNSVELRRYIESRNLAIGNNFIDYFQQHFNLYQKAKHGPITEVTYERGRQAFDSTKEVAFRRRDWKSLAVVSQDFIDEIYSNDLKRVTIY